MQELEQTTAGIPETREVEIATLSQWQLIRLRFMRHKLAIAGLFLLMVLYTIALFAEFFAPYASGRTDVDRIYSPPQTPGISLSQGFHAPKVRLVVNPVTFSKQYVLDADRVIPLGFFVKGEPCKLWGLIPMERRFLGARDPDEKWFLLGSDRYGRDVLSRIVYGSRISLTIGLMAIAVTFLLGISIGGISGYLGGAADNIIQRMIEIINSLPQIPLWLALGAALPADLPELRRYFLITIVLSLLSWTGLARVVRGKILSLRSEDYAVAARLIGASHGRILFRHLLPGFTSHIIVTLTLTIPGMILGETSLSFLGLGLREPVVSWGVMLQDCMSMQVVANYPWLMMPLIFIILTVLCFNFVGDGLRDAADPYSAR